MVLRGLGALALAATSASCSSTDAPPTLAAQGPGACEPYVPPSTFDPTSGAVSFSRDVMPLVARSCAFESCHGTLTGPTGGMYLGTDEAATYANLVGVPSNDVPSMDRVTPGDPATSFLQHKIDGDACTLSACGSTCAERMPQGQELMAVNDRLTFRAWIAQGAPSDIAGFDAGAP
jgi:hypothetical protein